MSEHKLVLAGAVAGRCFDVAKRTGVHVAIALRLSAAGYDTDELVLATDADTLGKIPGVGIVAARQILNGLSTNVG